MMPSPPDATALAADVRAGDVSPLELVDTAIDAAERLNPELNAIVAEDFERARADAKTFASLSEQPFAGVPTLQIGRAHV